MLQDVLLDYSNTINQFILFDDTFASKVFEDDECVMLLKNILLSEAYPGVFNDTQHTITNLHGHEIRVDVFVEDMFGHVFNVEVQRAKSGAIPQRARYYSSILDSNIFVTNEDYKHLPKSCVVFICEEDVLGYSMPINHIHRRVDENLELFDDKSEIIYVNGNIQDETPLGKLMHDFRCADPNDMYYGVLRKRVNYLKNGEGRREVCQLMEDFAKQYAKLYGQQERAIGEEIGKELGIQEGKELGIAQEQKKIAITMFEDGLSVEIIAKYLSLTKEQIEAYIDPVPAA